MDQPAPMLDRNYGGGSISIRTTSDELDAVDVDPYNTVDVVDQLERRFRIERRGQVKRDGVISDLFDRRILTIFERRFNNSSSGHQVLKAGEFQQLVSEYIPSHLVENIYRSIDVNDTGSVHYSDFINYLIASEEGSLFSNKTNTSRLVMHGQQVVEPDDSRNESHSDFIDCLCYLKKPQVPHHRLTAAAPSIYPSTASQLYPPCFSAAAAVYDSNGWTGRATAAVVR